MCIFSEQTFIDMYTEIHTGILYYTLDTKQSSATCQKAEKLQII